MALFVEVAYLKISKTYTISITKNTRVTQPIEKTSISLLMIWQQRWDISKKFLMRTKHYPMINYLIKRVSLMSIRAIWKQKTIKLTQYLSLLKIFSIEPLEEPIKVFKMYTRR